MAEPELLTSALSSAVNMDIEAFNRSSSYWIIKNHINGKDLVGTLPRTPFIILK